MRKVEGHDIIRPAQAASAAASAAPQLGRIDAVQHGGARRAQRGTARAHALVLARQLGGVVERGGREAGRYGSLPVPQSLPFARGGTARLGACLLRTWRVRARARARVGFGLRFGFGSG